MKYQFEEHCKDESLELYTLDRLDDLNTELLEEHILICEACRIRLEEADRYTKAMRSGAARIRSEEKRKQDRRRDRPFGWLPLPAPVWATAFAAFCGLAILGSVQMWKPSRSEPAVNVQLRAERGPATVAPAHHRLDLKLDVRGLQLGAAARAEIVDSDGNAVQKTSAVEVGQTVEIRTDRGFEPGTYFVRVFPAATHDAAREFALQLQ